MLFSLPRTHMGGGCNPYAISPLIEIELWEQLLLLLYTNNHYLLTVWLTLVQFHVELLSHSIYQRFMISVLILPCFRDTGDIVLCSWLLHRNEANHLVSSSAMPIITTLANNFVAASAYRTAYPSGTWRLRVSSTDLPTTYETIFYTTNFRFLSAA